MTRSHAARVHAAVAVAGVASAVAAVTAATAANAADEAATKTSIAVAAAAALIAAQCVEVAEGLGANKEDLSAVVSSAVNVKSAGDIVTATAQAATALRASATLRARQPPSRASSSRVVPTGSNLSRGHGSAAQLSGTDTGDEGQTSHGSAWKGRLRIRPSLAR
ncbi:hypothetical protein KFL_003580045 [Klebsormidium nitens]|uniref:VAN3-binding protein-like auxin canalisation domain-containing protein n=1 Tax=Klebsormidium nitens TaxID=105231 RepID=A0A1Y1IEJ9_KLENI|nr:hypothetical protein KFL_003580045 [Klebsormidium nitens]|eukprot:GAQ87511.1 hypothetical protein KFL_003580045 [Klebsormidium nitens]